ncbi:MAG: hypothetical protein LQ346_000770 [Caloplaca aetnensis]|nr:MAG: hypothetical protein LQ346_000770 [Caloplaca aetnensis]
MAEQSKPPFPFSTAATSGPSGGFFGQQTSTSQPQGSSVGSSKPPATSGSSLFGTTTAPGGNSIFGANNTSTGQTPSLFGGGGGGGAGQKATTDFNFAQKPPGDSGGVASSVFGLGQPSAGQQPGTSASLQGFATPSKPANATNPGTGQSSTPFGSGTSSIFQNPTSSTLASAATPTSKSTFSFVPLGSTTPADPPPSSQAPANPPFGLNLNNNNSNQNQGKNSLFPSLSTDTSSSQYSTSKATTPSQTTTGSGSSVFPNFGNQQNPSSTQPPASAGGTGLLGTLRGQTSSAPFGGQSVSASLSTKSALASAAEAQKPLFSLPSSASQAFGQDAQKTQTYATNPLSNLGVTAKSSDSSAPASSASAPNIFGNIGKTGDASKSGPPSSSAAPSFFNNLSKGQDTPSSSVGAANPSSQALAPNAASASNLFGGSGQPAASSGPSQSKTATVETQGNANTASGATLGQSTVGPAPSAQSRLKNKSMDEIITRWATDLAKYQKEFQKQAEKVATWDQMLVENSEKIQKLYGSTLEAERATAEVERQITAVENDQDELESWLDRYEEKVDQMIANAGDSLHGPDLERERTYQLAEKLSTRLDEMGRDLGNMIEEINDASSSLYKNARPDDPLSQVVRVLNNHLSQLQQIDQGASTLQSKVATAQRASRNLAPSNSVNGPSSDAADSFYRSFMGRR